MKNDNVVFLAVTSDDEKRVKAFVKKRGIRLPVYLCRGEFPFDLPTGGVPTTFILDQGVPTTFILDRQGAARFRLAGPANWDDDGARSFIRGLENN